MNALAVGNASQFAQLELLSEAKAITRLMLKSVMIVVACRKVHCAWGNVQLKAQSTGLSPDDLYSSFASA